MTKDPRTGDETSLEVWSQPSPPVPSARAVEMSSAPRRHGEPYSFADLVRTVSERRWTVALVTLAFVLAGAAYFVLTPRTYRSNTLIQVEGRSKGSVALPGVSGVGGEKLPAELEPEMEIVRSRTLLGGVVDQLGLEVEATPRRFPVFGSVLARRWAGRAPAPPVFGLSGYAWGGESIRVARLEVPDALLEVPLRLTATEGAGFRVTGADGALLLEGKVGQPALSPPGQARVELLVSELVARPGTEFRLLRHRRADVVEALQTELHVTEKARKSGILVLALESPDPVRIAAILNAIAALYLRQSLDRSSAEAGQALDFLESQLPSRKANVEAAEAALNAYQQGRRALNLPLEGQAVLNQRMEIEKELTVLEQRHAELRQQYTERHPAMIELAAKLRSLRGRQAEVSARLRQLPMAELESARLARDVKVATEQYLTLAGEAERLRVAKAGAAAHAAVVDPALVPYRPVSPRPTVLPLAALLGLAAGIAAAFAKKALAREANDAEEIERATGLAVYATLPHSRRQAALSRSSHRSESALPILSALDPTDATSENIWALRTSLQLALARAPGNIVALLGPGPEVGKSFVCVNLAHVLTASQRRVLLVDADLRRGKLHRYFDVARQPGLSEVVNGSSSLDAALIHTGALDVLPAGSVQSHPAELLARPSFEKLLVELSRRYDVVLVDTAPILAVADALAVARLADVNLLVLRSGRDSVGEVALTIKRLERSGVRVQGIVLNDGRRDPHRYDRYRAPFAIQRTDVSRPGD